ncbi:hypothetical protein ACFLWV_00880 [Chloroflexota bacterium]
MIKPPFRFGAFFFCAWLLMMFWGIIAPDIGLPTIGYPMAMLVTIALWLVVFPARWTFRGKTMARVSRARRASQSRETTGQDQINVTAVFSGSARRATSKSFTGGKITAVFGAVQLDLRNAVVEARPATLEVTAVLGGAEFRVPHNWVVEFDTNTVLGGTSDERSQVEAASEDSPHLIITGTTVLGGITIKD